MKRKFLTTTLLVCSFAICLAAVFADLNGKWSGVLKMTDGNELPLTYIFKVDGDKLTGSVSSPQGEIQLTDGKINGADFSFKIDVNGNTIPSVGKYYGDSTTIDIDFNGQKMHTKLLRDDK